MGLFLKVIKFVVMNYPVIKHVGGDIIDLIQKAKEARNAEAGGAK